jgi:mannose-1-phosphate guanylyltransferase
MSKSIDFRPVILAGRQRHPLLAPFPPRPRQAGAGARRGALHDSADRGAAEAAGRLDKTWIITNEYLAHEIADQLPGLPAEQIVQEPVARNTAPACGLAAFLIERQNPNAVLGCFLPTT